MVPLLVILCRFTDCGPAGVRWPIYYLWQTDPMPVCCKSREREREKERDRNTYNTHEQETTGNTRNINTRVLMSRETHTRNAHKKLTREIYTFKQQDKRVKKSN